jgi:hypothetical protein
MNDTLSLHLLSVAIHKGNTGLFHPSELPEKKLADLVFTIPVKNRIPFTLYECWTACYHNQGKIGSYKKHLLHKINKSLFFLDHPNVKINFKISDNIFNQKYFSYIGELQHPDFQYQFIILNTLMDLDELWNFNNNQEFIIGTLENSYH